MESRRWQHQRTDLSRIKARVERGQGPAHGVANHDRGLETRLSDQLRDVIDVIHRVVTGTPDPLGITMAAQIGRYDVVIVGKTLGETRIGASTGLGTPVAILSIPMFIALTDHFIGL